MKSTGVVRKLDNLGRIVIPIEIRRTLGIEISDSLEISVDADKVILTKYHQGCTFCDSTDAASLKEFGGHVICQNCIDKLKEL